MLVLWDSGRHRSTREDAKAPTAPWSIATKSTEIGRPIVTPYRIMIRATLRTPIMLFPVEATGARYLRLFAHALAPRGTCHPAD